MKDFINTWLKIFFAKNKILISYLIFLCSFISVPLFSDDLAKIIKVIDGDTFDVQFQNGTIDRVRLVGIDTPESLKENNPQEYQGINDPEYLKQWGYKAKNYTSKRLLYKEVLLKYDEIAGKRGFYGRLLAYVIIDGVNFNKELVELGLARAYIEAECELLQDLKLAQQIAFQNRVGLWSGKIEQIKTPGRCPIIVLEAHYDAAGNDNINLNDEYIIFKNIFDISIDLSNWIISDAGGKHHYKIHDGFLLKPGDEFTLFSGSGENGANSLFWMKHGTAVWNNNGDKVYITSPAGQIYELWSWK